MARTRSTLFRPILGSAYVVKNTKTNEEKVCRVLKASDSSKYGPVRSGKSCVRGKEFFKVLVDDEVYTMNNSNLNNTCLSMDGKWEFTNKKPSMSGIKAKKQKTKKVKTIVKKEKPVTSTIEFVSKEELSKIIKGTI